MPRPKLTEAERREITLSLLRREKGATELSREYGVLPQHVHRLRAEALSDPEGALTEAEAEADYRREVLRLL